MLRSSLCDYRDAYILVKGNISVNNSAAGGAAANNINKKVIFKNCKEIPAVNNDDDIVEFNGANAADSFDFRTKITGKTDDNGRIDNVEIMVLLKYWRTLEMPLINCEVKLILTWSADCVVICTDVADQVPKFTIPETNLYDSVVTLSTQDNAKLLPQLKSGFKRTIIWNKYLPKPVLSTQNPNLNHLVEPSFQGVKR